MLGVKLLVTKLPQHDDVTLLYPFCVWRLTCERLPTVARDTKLHGIRLAGRTRDAHNLRHDDTNEPRDARACDRMAGANKEEPSTHALAEWRYLSIRQCRRAKRKD